MPADPTSTRRVNPWVGLTFLILALVFRLTNAVVTSSELPALEHDFDVSGPTAELSLTLVLAIAGALIIPVGQLADRVGRVEVFTVGTIGMLVANLASGLAPNYAVFISSRVVEAIFFPAMGAASLALVAGAFTDERNRVHAFAMYGAGYGLALALASAVGGFFTAEVSWRWSFFMNIPILAAALVGVRYSFPSRTGRRPDAHINVVDGALLVVAVATLMTAIDRGPIDGWTGYVGALLVATLVAGVALAWRTSLRVRRRESSLFDRTLFSTPGFPVAVGVSWLMMFGAFGILTVMPLFWRIVGDLDALVVGFGLVPFGVGWALLASLAGPIGRRFGARRVVIGGLVVAAA